MIMEDCEGHSAPPFAKVGWTSDCDQRRKTLNIGNPHELTYAYIWSVSNMKEAEDAAHDELDERGLRLNCDGGNEWFRVEDDLDDIDEFAEIVRETIEDYIVKDEDSEEEGDRGLVVSSINRAPNQMQAAPKMATNYGHNNTKWRQDLKGNTLHVKYYCK